MSTINSSTTGHSPKQERKFANKLFIGLGIAIVAAFVIFLVMSRTSELKSNPAIEQLPTGQKPIPTEPLPVTPPSMETK
jgi:hypothetical protein